MSKRFSPIVLRWAATTLVVSSLLCIAPLLGNGFRYGFWQNGGLVAAVTAFGGVISAAMLYAHHVFASIRSLKPTAEDLGAAERVLKETPFGFTHHRTGRPWCFWEAAGGKLFLTSSRFIFRAHAGQFRQYELVIPLAELADVEPCHNMHVPKGLTVVRTDGTKELFSCGLMENVDEWVAAFKVLRTMGPMVEGRSEGQSSATANAGVQQTLRRSDDAYERGQQ